MVAANSKTTAIPTVMSIVLYEPAVEASELNQDAGPELDSVAKTLLSLTKDMLELVTFSSTRLS